MASGMDRAQQKRKKMQGNGAPQGYGQQSGASPFLDQPQSPEGQDAQAVQMAHERGAPSAPSLPEPPPPAFESMLGAPQGPQGDMIMQALARKPGGAQTQPMGPAMALGGMTPQMPQTLPEGTKMPWEQMAAERGVAGPAGNMGMPEMAAMGQPPPGTPPPPAMFDSMMGQQPQAPPPSPPPFDPAQAWQQTGGKPPAPPGATAAATTAGIGGWPGAEGKAEPRVTPQQTQAAAQAGQGLPPDQQQILMDALASIEGGGGQGVTPGGDRAAAARASRDAGFTDIENTDALATGDYVGNLEGFNTAGWGSGERGTGTMKNKFGQIASRYNPQVEGATKALMADPDFQAYWPEATLVEHPNGDLIDFGDGQGPVDVLRGARAGGAGEAWQWGVGATQGGAAPSGAPGAPQGGTGTGEGDQLSAMLMAALQGGGGQFGDGSVTIEKLIEALGLGKQAAPMLGGGAPQTPLP